MIRKIVRQLAFCAAIVAAPSSVEAGQQSAFTYQGQLKDGEIPVNETCDMSFRLWSDPDSTDPRFMFGEVSFVERDAVRVVNGLFNVTLDFGAEPFRGGPLFLEVLVACPTEREELTALRPRQPLTPTPFALYAFDGNEGPAGPPGAAGTDGLSCWDQDGDGVKDAEEDVNNDGAHDAEDCAGAAGGADLTLPFTGTNTADDPALYITQEGFFSAGIFLLDNPISNQPALAGSHSGAGAGVFGSNGGSGPAAWFTIPFGTGTSWTMKADNLALGQAAYFNCSNDANTSPTIESWNTASGPAGFFKTTRDQFALNTTPTLDVQNDSWGPTATFRSTNDVNSSDVVTITHVGNDNGTLAGNGLVVETNGIDYSMHAKNEGIGGAGYFQVTRFSNIGNAVYAVHEGRGRAAHFKTTNTQRDRPTVLVEMNDDEAGVQSEASGPGDALFGWSKNIGTAVRGLSEGTGGIAGWFQINGATNSSSALRADTNGLGKALEVHLTNTNSSARAMEVTTVGEGSAAFFHLDNNESSAAAVAVEHQGDGAGIVSHTWGNGPAVQGFATFGGPAIEGIVNGGIGDAGKFTIINASSAASAVRATSNGLGPAAFFENTNPSTDAVALHVAGRVRTRELEITAGADLSESFDIGGAASITPGMVVVIDPKRPGKLRVSTEAYDRKVAGIVSGAGGVGIGMIMKHEGTLASGEHPVALTGRVYCLVDATTAPIEPGDLLTTSHTPGHAMKVTANEHAHGASIGKAMTRLEQGKGLVLVLVNLQ